MKRCDTTRWAYTVRVNAEKSGALLVTIESNMLTFVKTITEALILFRNKDYTRAYPPENSHLNLKNCQKL